jgi:uncharacterized protein (DUF2141 family)
MLRFHHPIPDEKEGNMRFVVQFAAVMLISISAIGTPQQLMSAAPNTFTLTVVVEGVNAKGGKVGVLIFNNEKGWPEDVSSALRDVAVPARSGSVTITVPDLPAGDYAAVVLHDVNENKRLERNWLSKPTEQWGMSNNPHALVKAPAFSKARFRLDGNAELHIKMQ